MYLEVNELPETPGEKVIQGSVNSKLPMVAVIFKSSN
jgi:hypothetical protein